MTIGKALRVFALSIALSMCTSSVATEGDRIPRVGVLWPGDVDLWTKAFLEGLRQNGYTHGTTAIIDIRDTGSNFESGGKLAEQLIAQHPDVIYASPGVLAKYVQEALSRTGRDVPLVVFTWDPVGEGIVESAPHPART